MPSLFRGLPKHTSPGEDVHVLVLIHLAADVDAETAVNALVHVLNDRRRRVVVRVHAVGVLAATPAGSHVWVEVATYSRALGLELVHHLPKATLINHLEERHATR